MVKITLGRLPWSFQVDDGDTFCLRIQGRVVHTQLITAAEFISWYAHVQMSGAEGYFIGGDNLEEILRKQFVAAEFTYTSE